MSANSSEQFPQCGALLTHKIPITFHNLDNILSSRKDEQDKKSMISIEAMPGICLLSKRVLFGLYDTYIQGGFLTGPPKK